MFAHPKTAFDGLLQNRVVGGDPADKLVVVHPEAVDGCRGGGDVVVNSDVGISIKEDMRFVVPPGFHEVRPLSGTDPM